MAKKVSEYLGLMVDDSDKLLTEIVQGNFSHDDHLRANWLLYKCFKWRTSLDENDFKSKWGEDFKDMSQQGMDGWLQLNFPEAPLVDLLQLAVNLTRKIVGDEAAQVLYNWYSDYFTDEYLHDAATMSDWVTLILKTQPAYEGAAESLFGLTKNGVPYDTRYGAAEEDTQQHLLAQIVARASQVKPNLQFGATEIRQRIISLLLDCVELKAFGECKCGQRVEHGFTMCSMSGRSVDDHVPNVKLYDDRDVHLRRGYGRGDSRYGFGVRAEKK